jgi:hypothetical protein
MTELAPTSEPKPKLNLKRVSLSRLPFIVCTAVCIIYIAFLTRTYYWDGVLSSLYIEGVRQRAMPPAILFHPNHLLYAAFGYALYSIGIPIRAITLLQLLNALFGALTTAAVVLFVKDLTKNSLAALFAGILFAFGATWWKFATDADSYIISVCAITVAIYLATRGRSLPTIAACHVTGMLFHELAVFAYVPIVLALLLHEGRSRRTRIWHATTYVLLTAATTIATYLICYRFIHPQQPLLSWISSFAPTARTTHSAQQILISYPLSYAKLFLGGKFRFVPDYFSAPVALGLLLCAASLAGAFWLWKQTPQTGSRNTDKRPIVLLWSWLAPYAVFLAWFEPSNAFYKLFLWPPLVLLVAIRVSRSEPLLRASVALAISIAAWNFSGFIYPHTHVSADPVLALAKTMDRQMPPDATIYYAAFSPDDWYLDYFAPGRTWLPLGTADPLKERAKTVCLETTALEILRPQISPQQTWELTDRHRVRVECFTADRTQ